MLGGIDIGTTGCKITVYDEKGNCKYGAYRDYPVSRKLGEHEVSADAIWGGVQEILKDAAGKCKNLKAIGVTSFGESFVMLDKEDRPLRPVMLYTDPRGTEECKELTALLGSEKIEKTAGVKADSTYSLPKIMWVKKHCPEVFEKVKRILLIEDFIIYMLTGNACIDYSLAARTMAFDIRRLEWSREILDGAGIDSALFSKPVLSGTNAGCIKGSLAREWGLEPGTLVVPVGHDQVAAAIGTGVFESDCAVDGAGTVQCITPVYEGIPQGRAMAEGNYAVVPYVLPNKYVTYAYQYTGGALTSWYVKQMAKKEAEIANEQGKSVYEILEEDMRDEPTGILVLPHFAGAATPYMDVGSKGAVLGLTVEHTISDVYRALMEGVVFEMKLNMEYLAKADIYPKRLRAAGGGAASRVWMQMKADILNIPITSLGNMEAGTIGCVIQAGIAAGVFQDLKEAVSVMVSEKAVYMPRKEQHEAYEKEYERYKGLYEAVRKFM